MLLETILKDSPYKLTQFSPEQIVRIENTVQTHAMNEKETFSILCPILRKAIKLTPKEVVR
jgi:type I restriction enzyme M protein